MFTSSRILYVHDHPPLGGIDRAHGRVVERSLAGIAPFASLTVADLGTQSPLPAAVRETRSLSDELIDEVRAADLIVIAASPTQRAVTPPLQSWFRHFMRSRAHGAPIYAFGANPLLENWFNHILRADCTFRYTATGIEGLLSDKRAAIIGSASEEWAMRQAMDHQTAYAATLLGLMGIADVSILSSGAIAAEPLAPEPLAPKPRALPMAA